MNTYKIKNLQTPQKCLIFFFVISLIIGFAIALLQVYAETGFDTQKIILEYRGSSNPDLLAFPKPFREILQNTHAHALSIPLVYFLLSYLFLGTTVKSRTKSTLIALLFLSFFVDYSSLWLLRYVHENFIYAASVSHMISSPVYLFMCLRILWEIFQKKHVE